jgi:hypothetical protein
MQRSTLYRRKSSFLAFQPDRCLADPKTASALALTHPLYRRSGAPRTATSLLGDRKDGRIEATEIKSFPVG